MSRQQSHKVINLDCHHVRCSLQPVAETRDKQSDLWQRLILQYCRSQKVSARRISARMCAETSIRHAAKMQIQLVYVQVFIVSTSGGDQLPLFTNPSIDRESHPHEPCTETALAVGCAHLKLITSIASCRPVKQGGENILPECTGCSGCASCRL